MSENLDLVRSIYSDWERGDFTRTAWAHRDIELVWADGPSPTTWSGLRGAEAGWREFLGTWQDYRVHPEDYLAPDDERVLVLVRFTARGKVSGLEVGQSHPTGANMFHIRDRLVRRLVLYWDRDRALADVGLEASGVSANLELVRSIYANWERGDWTSASWAHPDIEFVFADGPSPGSFRGVAAMARAWRDYMSDWRDVRASAEELREIDSERVLVLLDFIGRGRASGVEVARASSRGANLFHIRNGRVTRLVLHFDRDRALADLGLEA